ncbi:MAG TPA: serine hydrolase domain-containing protein [Pyrinomonadaceae bacterium]|jgi:CubicO group peptidase (beta-lactamase class C family)|nr:serine hydrolase domain-containing protein [Pyrinomonadaceae bacterium]
MTHKSFLLIALLLSPSLFPFPALARNKKRDADPRPARIATLLRAYSDLDQLSGAVLVAEKGKILFRGASGFADKELRVPAAPEHRFLIGSLTKAFTAVLTLQEVAAGHISLDEPAVTYWKEFPDPSGGKITVRHLLTHRSGLKHWGAVRDFLDSRARLQQEQADIVALYAGKGLSFAPGTDEDYSSIGYMVLGILLEKVTGKPYGALLQERIFKPLGMTSSSLDDKVTVLTGRARPYRYNFLKARYDNAEYRDPSTTFSTGGILSNVDDLLRWDQALNTSKLLPDSLRAVVFDREKGEAEYGWRIDTLAPGVRSFWHVGLESGFRSEIVRVPARGQTIIVLGNLRDMDTDGICKRILRVLDGGTPELPKRSLMKALLAAAAEGGGDAAVNRFREILRAPAGYNTSENQALIAAIELRSDQACDRAAPIYEEWMKTYPASRNQSTALVGAADCRLKLGDLERARVHIERLTEVEPKNSSLPDLRRRLASQ